MSEYVPDRAAAIELFRKQMEPYGLTVDVSRCSITRFGDSSRQTLTLYTVPLPVKGNAAKLKALAAAGWNVRRKRIEPELFWRGSEWYQFYVEKDFTIPRIFADPRST